MGARGGSEGEGEGEGVRVKVIARRGGQVRQGVTVAMMNMSRHLAELCTRCAAACSIVGELLLESPTSTARANFLKHVEGWVRGGVSRGFEGFRGAGWGDLCARVCVRAGKEGTHSDSGSLTTTFSSSCDSSSASTPIAVTSTRLGAPLAAKVSAPSTRPSRWPST